MKIAIMQPYLFPYIGYFQLINAVDKFILLDDVNYIIRGWINRNRILVNGKEHLFSAPVKKASQNKKIAECEVVDGPWKGRLIKTLEFAYKKAPYYYQSTELVEECLNYPENNLSKWLTHQIKLICIYLQIPCVISNSNNDYNNTHLKGQDRLIDICRIELADSYLNPIGGVSLYDKNTFKNNGIKLNFLRTNNFIYNQLKPGFIKDLSIIDVLMFNSRDEIKNLLTKFELS